MPTSLVDIVNAWSHWKTLVMDTGGIKVAKANDYGSEKLLKGYEQHAVEAKAGPIMYGPARAVGQPQPAYSASIVSSNDSAVEQSVSIDLSKQTQQEFNWSVSQAVSLNLEVSATASVPEVAEVGTKLSTGLSVTNTNGSSIVNTQQWAETVPVRIPAYTSLASSLEITMAAYEIPWTCVVQLTGQVAIWYNKEQPNREGKYHHLYFVPIATVFQEMKDHPEQVDTTGYTINGLGVVVETSGVFTGGQGIASKVCFKQGALAAV